MVFGRAADGLCIRGKTLHPKSQFLCFFLFPSFIIIFFKYAFMLLFFKVK